MKKTKIFFIIIYCFINVLLLVSFNNDSKLIFQNRIKNKYPHIDMNSVFNGNYQKRFEEALSDHLLLSDNSIKLKRYIDSNTFNKIRFGETNTKYKLVLNNRYFYDDGDYIVDKCYTIPESQNSLIERVKKSYKNIKVKNKYLYYVNNSDSLCFDSNTNTLYEKVKEIFNNYKVDSFKIKDYNDYKKYYYKTDIHWNHKGSYEGYKDIIRMIYGNGEKLLIPSGEKLITKKSYGSIAATNQYFKTSEKLYVYDFDEISTYKNSYKSFSKNINYSIIYDNNYKYENMNNNRGNLLILTNSYGLSVKALIASHFKNTYVIDFRIHKNIDVNKLIKENRIDTLLVITSGISFLDENYIVE